MYDYRDDPRDAFVDDVLRGGPRLFSVSLTTTTRGGGNKEGDDRVESGCGGVVGMGYFPVHLRHPCIRERYETSRSRVNGSTAR